MKNPLLKDIRRVRAQRSKELARDFDRALDESHERLLKLCDVVVCPSGEKRLVLSANKMAAAATVTALAKTE